MTPSDYLNSFLFGYLPYIAVTLFITGVCYQVRHRNSAIQATSSQFISNDRLLVWGSRLFHFAILFVLFGHIMGLFTPGWLYKPFVSTETKRMLAIGMGGLFGLVALVGITMLAVRRLKAKPVRSTSKPPDFLLLALLLVQILLGLWSTYLTSVSSLELYLSISHWAQGVALFEPDVWRYVAPLPLIYKLHFVCGFFMLMIFPFTKLMHMLMVPIYYAIDAIRR